MSTLGFQEIKAVALAVEDPQRAQRFYGSTLELAPAFEGEQQIGFRLGDAIVLLKAVGDGWPARPSAELNPRITVATANAPQTERELIARGVTISDPVRAYPPENHYVGSFLDSEGNKIWFCSLRGGTT